jgi:hypothetical protein
MDVILRMSNNACYVEFYGCDKGIVVGSGDEKEIGKWTFVALGIKETRKLVSFLQNELKMLGEMELKDSIRESLGE